MAQTTNKRILARIKREKKRLLQALTGTSGIVAAACRKAGVSRFVFYDWQKKDPEFREKCEDILEMQKDVVEASILRKIQEGDTTMIIFYAKTKMRDRGYSERIECTGANGSPLFGAQEVDIDKLTDEQRAVLLSIGENALTDTGDNSKTTAEDTEGKEGQGDED